ncbi:peroxiredoxin family protein [Aegicerativicinus sediminis]|uniref:peroxiredoxin family protein n=1 Tax=Aegicerativicinus sediminis TaxID=2893202 RepID=UPI001E33AE56|nr:TlpA disulfide reductase family protein [Aegicerativicinus sediminis]
MRCILSIFFCVVLIGCKDSPEKEEKSITSLKPGIYRVELETMDEGKLAFNMKVNSANDLEIYNAEEIIEAEEITYHNDSVMVRFPAFEGFLIGKIEDSLVSGWFVKESLDRKVPFRALFGIETRYTIENEPKANIQGNWEVTFSPDNVEEIEKAKGIFDQSGNIVTGTFRTLTGDYRFLEGVMDGNILKLSAFDGSHAYYFEAEVTDSTMDGAFYSGSHFKEPFIGIRNDEFELDDPNSLTYLKEGYDRIEFEFPDSNGNMISLSDEAFDNKVVVLQIMGTWCPNCLDETRYLAGFYNDLDDPNLEFIGLAFEYAKTEEKAMEGLIRLRNDLDVRYPLLLAQFGTSNKKLAQEKLPMLNQVLSYPTTIILDKNKNVVSIHTGFNGPATGEKYEIFKKEFSETISYLLNQ